MSDSDERSKLVAELAERLLDQWKDDVPEGAPGAVVSLKVHGEVREFVVQQIQMSDMGKIQVLLQDRKSWELANRISP
jgi:hypothetical protein